MHVVMIPDQNKGDKVPFKGEDNPVPEVCAYFPNRGPQFLETKSLRFLPTLQGFFQDGQCFSGPFLSSRG